MPMADRFRVTFPRVPLPERLGGGTGIIVTGVRDPKDPLRLVLCIVISEKGQVHFNVPYTMPEIQHSIPCTLIEDPSGRAPAAGGQGGGGLIMAPGGVVGKQG